jgi:hypothetical protein
LRNEFFVSGFPSGFVKEMLPLRSFMIWLTGRGLSERTVSPTPEEKALAGEVAYVSTKEKIARSGNEFWRGGFGVDSSSV